jgi:hypothetical protein
MLTNFTEYLEDTKDIISVLILNFESHQQPFLCGTPNSNQCGTLGGHIVYTCKVIEFHGLIVTLSPLDDTFAWPIIFSD